MAMKITNQQENPLFSRQEITAETEFTGAVPSRAKLKQQLAKKLSVDDKLIVISKIDHSYGGHTAVIRANAYQDEKTLKRLEPGYLVKRDAPKKKEGEEQGEKQPEASEEKKGSQEEKPAKEEKAAPKEEKKQSAEPQKKEGGEAEKKEQKQQQGEGKEQQKGAKQEENKG